MTPDDLKSLAHAYSDLAAGMVQWRVSNLITDPKLGSKYNDQVADVVGASDQLEHKAVTAALAALQTSVAELKAATQKAQDALKVIKDITTVFAIAGAAVGIVAALMAPAVSGAAVAGAMDGLVQAVQKATAPPTAPTGTTGSTS